MFDIEKELEEKGLTKETYEQLLEDCQKKVGKETDLDWSEIAEKYHLEWNGDSLRKGNISLVGGAFVKQYYEEKIAQENSMSENKYLAKLEEKKRELEREKIQFRDQRNAWQKQNYANARLETTLSILEDKLKTIGKVNFENFPIPVITGNKEMIVMLSDLHIGHTFNSCFGEYNSDIAKSRLNKYLLKVNEVAKLHNVKKVHVVSLGDQISGAIHRTIAVTNKENVIEQIKLATEIISSFCHELSKVFEDVYFYNVSGNHSRIDRKDDALHDERLDDLIGWAVSLCLSHIDNFHYMKHRNIDIGIADICVCGKPYIAVHGDMDSMSKQGVANLTMLLGFIPYAILKGHMHTPAMNEFSGVKMIQSGSLVGGGDDYTIEKRMTGNPSQTLLVCDDEGVDCIYHVDLK